LGADEHEVSPEGDPGLVHRRNLVWMPSPRETGSSDTVLSTDILEHLIRLFACRGYEWPPAPEVGFPVTHTLKRRLSDRFTDTATLGALIAKAPGSAAESLREAQEHRARRPFILETPLGPLRSGSEETERECGDGLHHSCRSASTGSIVAARQAG